MTLERAFQDWQAFPCRETLGTLGRAAESRLKASLPQPGPDEVEIEVMRMFEEEP